jgi:hypothetical protein
MRPLGICKYFLKRQIKNKVRALQNKLELLSDAGSSNTHTESFKNFGRFNKIQNNVTSSNQAYFAKKEWTVWNLNPVQSGDITRLLPFF